MVAELTPIDLKLSKEVALTWTTGTDDETDYKFDVPSGEFILMIEAPATDDAIITIDAGDYWHSDLGALTFTVGNGEFGAVGPLETARFLQDDGTITFSVDIDGSTDSEDDVEYAVLVMPALGVDRA